MLETILGLLFAFFLGLQHAFEPDHVSAVSTIILNNKSIKKSLFQSSLWTLGHTITIVILGIAIFLVKATIPTSITRLSEFLVGVVLILLGLNVIREFIIRKIHLHMHSHGTYTHLHFHSHSHTSNHLHNHAFNADKKALLIGILHGIAGSAVLILLTTFNSFAYTIIYLLIFGFGTLFGMNIISYLISLPILATRKRFLFMNKLIKLSISIFSIAIGIRIIAFNMSEIYHWFI